VFAIAAIIADYQVAGLIRRKKPLNTRACGRRVCVRQARVRATGYWQTLAFLGGRSDSFNGGGGGGVNKNRADCLIKEPR